MGTLGNLLPLLILFTVVSIGAYIGYQIYTFANDVADRGVKKMEKKNVTFSKEGMRVAVKDVKDEDYADKTQSVLVNAWNNASFPNYKSRLWGNGSQPKKENIGPSSPSSVAQPSASRTTSASGLKQRSS